MFQLNNKEFKNLKTQFATSSLGGRRRIPFAFTENGVLMLSIKEIILIFEYINRLEQEKQLVTDRIVVKIIDFNRKYFVINKVLCKLRNVIYVT